jgi:hypothetical protein
MNHFKYHQIPSPAQFQKDSSVTLALRKSDKILTHVDWLLERYTHYTISTTDWSMRRVILADLFLTCNYWIKLYHERHPRILKERYPAVLALFEAVVEKLGELLQCTKGQVAQALDEIYGRTMHAHGFEVDYKEGRAKYFSKAEAAIYRIRFQGGLAYQYEWWKPNFGRKLVPAESERAFVEISRRGANGADRAFTKKNFAGFVMTIERELYMAKHDIGTSHGHDGLFHSSYTKGQQVMMAGTMLIENGRIKAIRGDSGHYKPTEQNMAMLLQALGMFGVDLSRIELYSWDDRLIGNALAFLKSNLSWSQFCSQRSNEQAHRVNGAAAYQRFGPKPPAPPTPAEPAFYNITN